MFISYVHQIKSKSKDTYSQILLGMWMDGLLRRVENEVARDLLLRAGLVVEWDSHTLGVG